MKKDIQYTVVPQTFPKRSTIIMQYMTPGSILHITFYYVSNGIFFQHSSIQAFLLHDHWQSERGMESGFCQERDSHESVHGVSFRFKTSQQVKIVVLNKCPLLKEPLLHHLLTPPPYSLASVGQAVIQGTVQSVGWHSWQFFWGATWAVWSPSNVCQVIQQIFKACAPLIFIPMPCKTALLFL